MNNSVLAINGGSPVRTVPFPAHRTIGDEEVKEVTSVLRGGVLSKFLGAHHEDFYGGPQVRAAEEEWATYFGAKHAVSVNSNSSGLICAVGAIGLQPGDEVIVSPYSMSISAVAPMFYGGIPVFADVEKNYFSLDATSVESQITEKTKAILVVDLFGQPYDVNGINALAKKYNLKIIEDCAQAPGAKYGNEHAGVLGDIGVFSLNYHKHIHTGEGGFILTNNDDLAERMKLIRNHAESVVGHREFTDFRNMLGFNFRMTEIEAAIARTQLKKLNDLTIKRLENISYLENGLREIPALSLPKIRKNATHVYYQHACLWDESTAKISRNKFINAVKAELPHFELRESEGVKLGVGYVKPLYRLPIFRGLACNTNFQSSRDYSNDYFKNVEDLHFQEIFHHEFMVPSMKQKDLDDVITAFSKVWESRSIIADRE